MDRLMVWKNAKKIIHQEIEVHNYSTVQLYGNGNKTDLLTEEGLAAATPACDGVLNRPRSVCLPWWTEYVALYRVGWASDTPVLFRILCRADGSAANSVSDIKWEDDQDLISSKVWYEQYNQCYKSNLYFTSMLNLKVNYNSPKFSTSGTSVSVPNTNPRSCLWPEFCLCFWWWERWGS